MSKFMAQLSLNMTQLFSAIFDGSGMLKKLRIISNT